MKPLRLLAVLALAVASSVCFAADTAAPAAPAAASTAPKPTAAEKRAASVLKDLKLADAAKESAARAILTTHFDALQTWHAAHDAAIAPLWTEWAARRSPPENDEAAAAKVGEKIDAVYADFRPQHDAFLAALAKELTPAQVDGVKNYLTRSPGLDRTYNAYLEMIPQFTDADKAFIRQKLTIAREQAIDTTADKEVVNFFKRQKVLCEAYIDAQGYDYKKSYAAWIERSKAAAAKK